MDVPPGPGRHWSDASLNDPELPFFENGTCSLRFCVAAGDDGTPWDPGHCWPITFFSRPEPLWEICSVGLSQIWALQVF
jgi:hypothetical protein